MGLGPYRGRPVLKLGTSLAHHVASAYARVEDAGWLCARLDGFDLHGRVAFGAADRKCCRPAYVIGARFGRPDRSGSAKVIGPGSADLIRLF